MLQATINELIDHVHERAPENRSYSRDALSNGIPGLPEPVAHFLVQSIDYRIHERISAVADDPWLNPSHSALEQPLRDLEERLSETACIPAGEWRRASSEAIREVVTYLVEPVSELTDFVFRRESPLPISDVRRRMAHFSPYSYLHSVFSAFADRKNVETIGRERFGEVLQRIDRQMVADYTADKWEGLFQPLFQVTADIDDTTGDASVPASLIRRLASNKGFTELVHTLDQRGQSRINAAQLRRLIESALDAEEKAPDASSSQPAGAAGPSEPAGDEPQPRWKQFQRGGRSNPAAPNPPNDRSSRERDSQPPAGDQSASGSSGQPLWQRFQNAGSKDASRQQPKDTGGNSSAPASPPTRPPAASSSSSSGPSPGSPPKTTGPQTAVPSQESQPSQESRSGQPASQGLDTDEREVLGTVPSDQRARFVRHLFNGSEASYADALAELRHVNTWEAASSLIAKKVFLPNQVNIYSEPAVTFTDLVEARYRKESSVQ